MAGPGATQLNSALLLDRDSAPSVRETIGRFLTSAVTADFAVAHVRVAAIDLTEQEMSAVQHCRFLLARLDAEFGADALALTRDQRHAQLRRLLDFVGSGRVEVRSIGTASWLPDFSIYRGSDGTGEATLLLGAHYFQTLFARGAPLTCVLRDQDAVTCAARNFETLWNTAHDVLPVIHETLTEVLDATAVPAGFTARDRAQNPEGLAGPRR